MDRIRRLSMEIMDQHKSDFGVDFSDNKKALDKISIIRSKGLKNEIAGFITKFLKHEIHEQKLKEEREKQFNQQVSENQTEEAPETVETPEASNEEETVTEETVVETSESTTTDDSTESTS